MQVDVLYEPESKNQSVSYIWTDDKRLLIAKGLCKCPKTESVVHGYQKYGVRVFDQSQSFKDDYDCEIFVI